MKPSDYLPIIFSFLGLLGGFVAWVLNLQIKHDISENNEKVEKALTEMREKTHLEINALKDKLLLDISNSKDKSSDKVDGVTKDLNDLKANLSDKIQSVVNGSYVRTDLYQQSLAGVHERFVSFKQLLEVTLQSIQSSLDKQILDLKERITHGKG